MTRDQRASLREACETYQRALDADEPEDLTRGGEAYLDAVAYPRDTVLPLLDDLDAAEARAEKAEADAAAMRAHMSLDGALGVLGARRTVCRGRRGQIVDAQGVPLFAGTILQMQAWAAEELKRRGGRALLDEVAALRARVAELEAKTRAAAPKTLNWREVKDPATGELLIFPVDEVTP